MNTVKFECVNNLRDFTDSMLFDSGTNIACGKFEENGTTVEVSLEIRGDVNVEFNGEIYFAPSEFPQELIRLIKEKEMWWLDESVVCVNFNNWYEYIYSIDGEPVDGILYESHDLSKDTSDNIFEEMEYIAQQVFSEIREHYSKTSV